MHSTAALLERLGHRVVERTPAYPQTLPLASLARILPGLAADVAGLPHRDRLEHRDRLAATIGSLLGRRAAARARAAEPALSSRPNAIFEDLDVVMTPVTPTVPFDAGRFQSRGFLKSWLANARLFAFTLPWNYTGQPAAAVPAGFTEHGLPLSVQLISRPHDEPTLIALAAQLHAARPWSDQTPPLA